MNLKSFKFFDFDSTEQISNVLNNPTQGQEATIEVNIGDSASSVSLIVQGKTDLENQEKWYNLSAISLSDFTVSKKIVKSGLYSIPLSGISKCRIVSENPVGGFKVYGISIG